MSEPVSESQLERAVAFIMKAAFGVQCLTAAALLFVPFSFEKRSILGLDFDYMIVLAVYCAAFMTSAAIAAGRRHFRFVLLQVAILAGGITLICSGLAVNL